MGEDDGKREEGGGGGEINKKSIRAALMPNDELWDRKWLPLGPGECTIRTHTNLLGYAVKLYTSWFCPFAQRGWIALEECKVKYKWVEINPYQVDPTKPGGYTKLSLSLEQKRSLYPDFIRASPRGLVPAMEHFDLDGNGKDDSKKDAAGRVIWESLPLAEYIGRVYGKNSLLPDDPYDRAMVQIWINHCNDRIQKEYYSALMSSKNNTDDGDACRRHIENLYTELIALANAMRDDDDGKSPSFFLGGRFSLFEVAFAPFYQRILWVGGHYLNLSLPPESDHYDQHRKEWDRLQRWWKATSSRKSVNKTFVNKNRLIASYNDYSTNVATSDFAKLTRK